MDRTTDGKGMEMMGAEAADPGIVEHLKTILRRDLKLGAAAPIADDMPFFGGDVDIDSLDILLLVTSIEKEFGIKVPTAAVGREIFQNVGTLTRFIQKHLGEQAPRAVDYLARLPHRPPFRFVSRVNQVKEGEFAEGVWSVAGDEAFLAGHFPGNPIVPGVLIAEALAQLSGLAGPVAADQGKLAHFDLRFDASVRPPAEVVLKAKFVRQMGALQQFEVEASSNGAVVARGTLTLHRMATGGGAS